MTLLHGSYRPSARLDSQNGAIKGTNLRQRLAGWRPFGRKTAKQAVQTLGWTLLHSASAFRTLGTLLRAVAELHHGFKYFRQRLGHVVPAG